MLCSSSLFAAPRPTSGDEEAEAGTSTASGIGLHPDRGTRLYACLSCQLVYLSLSTWSSGPLVSPYRATSHRQNAASLFGFLIIIFGAGYG